MDTDLPTIPAAFTDIDDSELRARIAVTWKGPQIAPGLLAWIDGASEWEPNRRRGFDCKLQPPEAAIDPAEDEVCINAAMAMRARTRRRSSRSLMYWWEGHPRADSGV